MRIKPFRGYRHGIGRERDLTNMVLIDGRITIGRSRNTPPAGGH